MLKKTIIALAVRCILSGLLFQQVLSTNAIAQGTDPLDLLADRLTEIQPTLNSPDKVAQLVRRFSHEEDWMGLEVLTAPGQLVKGRLHFPLENVDPSTWLQIHEGLDVKYQPLEGATQTVEVIIPKVGPRLCLIRETYNYQIQYKTADAGNPFVKFFTNKSDTFEDFGEMDVTCQSSYFIETEGQKAKDVIPLSDCTETIRPNTQLRFCGVNRIQLIENPLQF